MHALPPAATTPPADEKPAIKSEDLKALDSALGGALSDIVSLFEFSGKKVRHCSGWGRLAGLASWTGRVWAGLGRCTPVSCRRMVQNAA